MDRQGLYSSEQLLQQGEPNQLRQKKNPMLDRSLYLKVDSALEGMGKA